MGSGYLLIGSTFSWLPVRATRYGSSSPRDQGRVAIPSTACRFDTKTGSTERRRFLSEPCDGHWLVRPSSEHRPRYRATHHRRSAHDGERDSGGVEGSASVK